MQAAFYLGWAIAGVLVAIGVYALSAPHAVSRHYGVEAHGRDALAFVRASGVRDIALGVLLAAVAFVHSLPLLIIFAAIGIIVSIADLRIIGHHGEVKRFHRPHAIHASGIVAFVLVIAMALFAIGR